MNENNDEKKQKFKKKTVITLESNENLWIQTNKMKWTQTAFPQRTVEISKEKNTVENLKFFLRRNTDEKGIRLIERVNEWTVLVTLGVRSMTNHFVSFFRVIWYFYEFVFVIIVVVVLVIVNVLVFEKRKLNEGVNEWVGCD